MYGMYGIVYSWHLPGIPGYRGIVMVYITATGIVCILVLH
jgi:hypothetical protein